MNLCEYCGKLANYQFKNKIFCCSTHPSGCKGQQQKKKQTSLERYGVENYRNNLKSKATRKEKYGNETYNNRESAKATLLENYGVDNISKLEDIKLKKNNTFNTNYAEESDNRLQLINRKQATWANKDMGEVNDKRRKTCMGKYGVDNPLKVESIAKEVSTKNKANTDSRIFKAKKTILEKYGVEFISQVPEIHEKQQKYKWKEYKLPSGRNIKLQGYENKALDVLLGQFNEDEIIISRAQMPELWYNYESKNRRYYADIFIPKENKIIEVKSKWTFSVKKEQHYQKRKSCLDNGFNFEFWIFNDKDNTFYKE